MSSPSSSTCPPQLQLSIPANSTSFKRSFEEFGFDLDSPTTGGEPVAAGSTTNGERRDRSKRARSASSLSEETSSRGSTALSTSSGGSSLSSAAAAPSPTFLAPPRIPTPVIQDIDMSDYHSDSDDRFQAAFARFTEFDRNISALRSRSPSLPRSQTPPPVLPPLSLSEDTVPDAEESASFDIRDLMGSSTHFPRGSSTQSQASSATDYDYLAPLSGSEPASAHQPLFTLADILNDQSADMSQDQSPSSWSPRLDVLRPSSPLLRDIDDLSPSTSDDSDERTSSFQTQWPDPVHPHPYTPSTSLPSATPFLPLPHGIGTASRYLSEALQSFNHSEDPNDSNELSDSEWIYQMSMQQTNRPNPTLRSSSRPRPTSRRYTSVNSLAERSAEARRRAEIMTRLETEFALDSEDDDPIPHLPPLPYERLSRNDPWPESFDRTDTVLHRHPSFASERAAQLRADLEQSSFDRLRYVAASRQDVASFPHAPSPGHNQALSFDYMDQHTRRSTESIVESRYPSASSGAQSEQSEPPRASARRSFPSPPVIPPPDLGPGVIFIPHELEHVQTPRPSEHNINYPHNGRPEHQRTQSDMSWLPLPTPPSPVETSPVRSNPPPLSQITPEMYEPGPFRNSLMWVAQRRERRLTEQRREQRLADAARAPTLPRLSFEERGDFGLRLDASQSALREHNRIVEEDINRFRAYREELRRRDTSTSARARAQTPSDSVEPRPVFSHRFGAEEEPDGATRRSADIHQLLVSRNARLRNEAAITASRSEYTPQEGLNHALETLRRSNEQRPTRGVREEWGRIEDRELGRDLESRYLSRFVPRRRTSPLRSSASGVVNGSRNGSRHSRHGESGFRPLFVGEYEPFGAPMRARRRLGGFRLGDFIRDEDFDDSYESLLSLSSLLGDAVPKATPVDVISGLKSGLYKEWQTLEGDKRCPICLDDYALTDTVTKLNDCPHWLHKECLEQWLKSASTCPVCRHPVVPSSGGNPPNRSTSRSRRAGDPPPNFLRTFPRPRRDRDRDQDGDQDRDPAFYF